MGELTFGGGWGVVGASTGGIFLGGGMSKFSAGGRELYPILPSRKTNAIVPACIVIPLANHISAIFSVPQA